MKTCTKCGVEKPLSEYGKHVGGKNGLSSICRFCLNTRSARWRAEHPRAGVETERRWREKNRKTINARAKKWRSENPEKARLCRERYLSTHPTVKAVRTETTLAKQKEWKKEHPDRVKAWREKTRTSPKGKLNHNIGVSVRKALHGEKLGRQWRALVDFTVDQLKNHLEKRFEPGMTWENYGTFWEIDHKIPVSVFNFSKPEDIDFRLCWSLKNLQPLESKQNRCKGTRLDRPFQPSLCVNI